MMPEQQISIREALELENDQLHKRITELEAELAGYIFAAESLQQAARDKNTKLEARIEAVKKCKTYYAYSIKGIYQNMVESPNGEGAFLNHGEVMKALECE